MTWTEIRVIHPFLPKSSDGWHQHLNGGGWVQDTATVAETAHVGERAIVYDNARVFYRARVYGNARVCGNAWINARVCGDVSIPITPLCIQGTKYPIAWVGGDLVRSGCITKPIQWWLENVERCAEENGYNEVEQIEYRMHVEHIHRWMEIYAQKTA